MKVLVMGAGVIGVTTAYQLLKDGHEVAARASGRGGRTGVPSPQAPSR